MSRTVTLNYDRIGDGPSVLILHGLFGAHRNWRAVTTVLAEHYCVYSVDLRNHGDSAHGESMDYETLAADVATWVDTLSFSEVSLLGHSMGGKVAMTLALSNPRWLQRLLIVDIAPFAYPNEYDEILAAMAALKLDPGLRRKDADRALADALPDAVVRGFILQNLRFAKDKPPYWRINLAAISASIESIVGAIPVQPGARFAGATTFIRGANSDRISVDGFPELKVLFPHAELVTIPDAGHWPHTENPRAFLRVVQNALTA